MKRNIAIAVLIITIVAAAIALAPSQQTTESELIRIHIRANSNQESDQSVKYAVRDAIVAYLTPVLQSAITRQDAFAILQNHLTEVENQANAVLKSRGHAYKAKAELLTEYFPTRYYEEIEVESGYYDALILNLGEADGDNWWCVVYPPLCFLNTQGTNKLKYKSKLIEILTKK